MQRARHRFVAWVVLTLAGSALAALPDGDDRLFSLSRTHGPAPLDAVGLVLVLVGFAAYVAGLVAARARLVRRDVALAAVPYVAGCALTAWSVVTDTGAWWALGVAVAHSGMGWLALRVSRATA